MSLINHVSFDLEQFPCKLRFRKIAKGIEKGKVRAVVMPERFGAAPLIYIGKF